jgi:hypothetical protein
VLGIIAGTLVARQSMVASAARERMRLLGLGWRAQLGRDGKETRDYQHLERLALGVVINT